MDAEDNDAEVRKAVTKLSTISEILVQGYGDALLGCIGALSDIRSCETCTMQGNGYCDEHNISDVLNDALQATEEMTEQLNFVKES